MQELLKLIEVMVWPIVAILMIYKFERPISKLLSQISKFKAGSLEVEFEEKVRELQMSYESKEDEVVEQALDQEEIMRLSKSNPRKAILEAWKNLEINMKRTVIRNSGSPVMDTSTSYKTIESLEHLALLKEEDLTLAKQLRGLRNEVRLLGGFDVSELSAASYIAMSEILNEKLKRSGVTEELL